jgi:Ca2+-binding RTX toxin-like protein
MESELRSRGAVGLLILSVVVIAVFPGRAGADRPRLCFGKTASIIGRGAIRGTAHADVIVGAVGNDWIVGGGGNDLICSGGGDDRVVGQVGSDSIDVGPGLDRVEGGNGSDRILGGAGRDLLRGNRGNDELLGGPGARDFADGGLGDDTIAGGPGAFDQLIGGIGNDSLDGGPGNGDLLRGDRGADRYEGGNGAHDVASYAVSGLGGDVAGGKGVLVDLAAGTAEHDGTDHLHGVEDVLGTAFADVIQGDGEPNVLYGGGGFDDLQGLGTGDVAHGGINLDRCLAVEVADACELVGTAGVPSPAEVLFGGKPFPAGPKLEVDLVGGPSAVSLTAVVDFPGFLREGSGIDITVSFAEGAWLVAQAQIPIEAGDGCELVSPAEARCPVSGTPDAVLLGGSAGDDRLEVAPTVPPTVSAVIAGNYGSDQILGGPGDDSLNGISDGPLATDVVLGRGGDDALTGGVVLAGGPGSDLLIARVCGGESVSGGVGVDSVSFARLESIGIEATIGGTAGFAPVTSGPRPDSGGCPVEVAAQPTHIGESVESIEGSPLDDVLRGDGGRNILLGRGGDDRLSGGPSDDFLVGGTGRDELFGEPGADRLYARDSGRDEELNCGAGGRGDVASIDKQDPLPAACRLLNKLP